MDGIDRVRAAALISRRMGRPVAPTTLRYWERVGLLNPIPALCRGPHHPARYRLSDLVAAEMLCALRFEGVSLQRLRKALEEMARVMPGIVDAPPEWRLAVRPSGEIVRVESDLALLELTRNPGQLAVVLDAGEIARCAREILETSHAA